MWSFLLSHFAIVSSWLFLDSARFRSFIILGARLAYLWMKSLRVIEALSSKKGHTDVPLPCSKPFTDISKNGPKNDFLWFKACLTDGLCLSQNSIEFVSLDSRKLRILKKSYQSQQTRFLKWRSRTTGFLVRCRQNSPVRKSRNSELGLRKSACLHLAGDRINLESRPTDSAWWRPKRAFWGQKRMFSEMKKDSKIGNSEVLELLATWHITDERSVPPLLAVSS